MRSLLLICLGICFTLSGCHHTKTNSFAKKPASTPTPKPQAVLDVKQAQGRLYAASMAAKKEARIAATAPVVSLAQNQAKSALLAARKTYGAIIPGPLPKTESYTKLLNTFQNPTGARSVGSTSGGRLLGAKILAQKGKHHEIVARARTRKTNFGTPTLINMILNAAKTVYKKHNGIRLAVGNISTKNGGDIRWSVSHNSGRDADLAFYVRHAKTGKRMVSPDLIHFDDEGKSLDKKHPNLVFDVPLNWTLTRALLEDPKGQIQYLFISNALKKSLIDYAIKTKVPKQIIEQARQVLKQPTDSLPHNDHFHLRITCPRQDKLVGCIDRGPKWSWVDWHDDDILAHALEIQRGLKTSKVYEVQANLLTYLRALRAPFGADIALNFARKTNNDALRLQALRVAGSNYRWSGAAIAQTKLLITQPTTTSRQQYHAYKLLRRSLDSGVIDFAKQRITNTKLTTREKQLAFGALSHHMERDLVPFLLDHLDDKHPDIRHSAAMILRRITNREDATDWNTATANDRKKSIEAWRTWWDDYSGQPREVWLAQGFSKLGVDKQTAITLQAVPSLIDLLPKGADHTVYNVNKTLRLVTGRWASLEQKDGKKLHAFWKKWWRRNRKRLLSQS